ncbi:MAG: hypothetical protein D6698_01260 [Gammaproteobacteria bacterium]|nr:MAG: hypothetical protein D6698_01260 [Gammaproteobacteria bacterium]
MIPPLKVKRRSAIILLLAFASLAACGQKGDLYLPDQPHDSETYNTIVLS